VNVNVLALPLLLVKAIFPPESVLIPKEFKTMLRATFMSNVPALTSALDPPRLLELEIAFSFSNLRRGASPSMAPFTLTKPVAALLLPERIKVPELILVVPV
jgi:hypothetical protein